MRWIWIRHGETDWNREQRYVGHLDVPLNDKGKQQARRLAERLAEEALFQVYTSDLLRCRQTAEPLCARLGLQPVAVAQLRELDFGQWEGKSFAEIRAANPQRLTAWYADPFRKSPPGGETLSDLAERVDGWLHSLQRKMKEGETAVIVSHGGVIRWFHSRWLYGDPALFWQVEGCGHGEGWIATWERGTWRARRLGWEER